MMSRQRMATAALGAIAILVPCRGEDLHVEGRITSVLLRDRDGDGAGDIWVSYHEAGQRFLGLFRGGPSISRSPDSIVSIDPQAVLFAVGDFGPEKALDLVLFSRASAVLYPFPSGDGPAAPRKILATDLFFVLPSRKALPAWLSAEKLDLDGDAIEDLLIPERRQLRICLGAGSGGEAGPAASPASPWKREATLPVGYYVLSDSREERIRLAVEDFAEEDKEPGSLLDATAAYPFPVPLDVDGDGRLDVIVKQPGFKLEVFRQGEPGHFGEEPFARIEMPWLKDAAGFQLIDLNGDRRIDAVSSQLLLKDLATEVKVFIQDPGQPGLGFHTPRQALRVAGFFRRPDLADADGDGRLDLIVSTFRVDLLEQVKKSVVEELEITHEVFTGKLDPPFDRRPAFQRKFLLRTRDLEGGASKPLIHARHDLTGDGRPDILFLDSGQALRLYRALEARGLRYEDDPSFSRKVEDPAEVIIGDLDGRAGEEVLLRFERRLQVERAR